MEVTLKDLLAEIRNLSFLFYGHTVIWVIVLGYVFFLSRREKNLRDEIEELKKEVSKQVNREQATIFSCVPFYLSTCYLYGARQIWDQENLQR